ncbi:MAG TPA: hypothetical protein DHV36_00585 [Desulfobacteraceae bacterium]|nr:hypothetical protein [Desulfobacteraceae bacterium]
MFEAIKKIIGGITPGPPTEDQDDLSINLALTVLLFDAAYADGECTAQEKAHLIDTLETNFKVPREEIDALLADREKQREEHVELFRYTRFLNEHFSEAKKKILLESVWRIILIDGHLEAHEDHFAHRLSDLLNLSHKDLIDAKLRARDQLS